MLKALESEVIGDGSKSKSLGITVFSMYFYQVFDDTWGHLRYLSIFTSYQYHHHDQWGKGCRDVLNRSPCKMSGSDFGHTHAVLRIDKLFWALSQKLCPLQRTIKIISVASLFKDDKKFVDFALAATLWYSLIANLMYSMYSSHLQPKRGIDNIDKPSPILEWWRTELGALYLLKEWVECHSDVKGSCKKSKGCIDLCNMHWIYLKYHFIKNAFTASWEIKKFWMFENHESCSLPRRFWDGH